MTVARCNGVYSLPRVALLYAPLYYVVLRAIDVAFTMTWSLSPAVDLDLATLICPDSLTSSGFPRQRLVAR